MILSGNLTCSPFLFVSDKRNMASPRCMGCRICLALLFSSLRCQTTDGNNMTPQLQLNGTCACRDQESKIYNLAKLGRTDGKPRLATNMYISKYFGDKPKMHSVRLVWDSN